MVRQLSGFVVLHMLHTSHPLATHCETDWGGGEGGEPPKKVNKNVTYTVRVHLPGFVLTLKYKATLEWWHYVRGELCVESPYKDPNTNSSLTYYCIVYTTADSSELQYTVTKVIDFPPYKMKCSGENVIVRGIFHVCDIAEIWITYGQCTLLGLSQILRYSTKS